MGKGDNRKPTKETKKPKKEKIKVVTTTAGSKSSLTPPAKPKS